MKERKRCSAKYDAGNRGVCSAAGRSADQSVVATQLMRFAGERHVDDVLDHLLRDIAVDLVHLKEDLQPTIDFHLHSANPHRIHRVDCMLPKLQ